MALGARPQDASRLVEVASERRMASRKSLNDGILQDIVSWTCSACRGRAHPHKALKLESITHNSLVSW